MLPDVVFLETTTHLVVRLGGEYELLATAEVLQDIRVRAQQTPHTRILIDARELSSPAIEFSRFLAGVSFAKHFPLLRVAVLSKQKAADTLLENAAVNRGAQVYVCDDTEEALHWLLKT